MNEKEMRNKVFPVISYIYGEIDIAEIKSLISNSPDLDNDEFKISETRPGERKINQKVGNLVCHQHEGIRSYGIYGIDKTKKPACVYLETAAGKSISKDLIECKKKEVERLLYLKKERAASKRDTLYCAALEYVKECERRRLSGIVDRQKLDELLDNEELNNFIYQFGFDLMSYNEDGVPVAVIVRMSEGDKDTLSDFTTNERAIIKSRIAPKMCYVYDVYNFIALGAGDTEVKDATAVAADLND